MTSRRSDSTRLFLSRQSLASATAPVWTTTTSSGGQSDYQQQQQQQQQRTSANSSDPYPPLFPYRTTQRPLIPRPAPIVSNVGSSFLNLTSNHQGEYATPELVNSAYNVDTTGLRREDSLSSELSSSAKLSESHIYSHIYEPSGCCCPACDRVGGGTSCTVAGPHHQQQQQHSHDHDFYEAPSATRVGAFCAQHAAFPYQLKSTSSLYIGGDSPKKKNLGLSGSPDSSSVGAFAPLGKQRPPNKRCLVVALALALLVILGLALLTSFVVFLVSSYESYYEEDSASSLAHSRNSNQTKPSFLIKDSSSSPAATSGATTGGDSLDSALAAATLDRPGDLDDAYDDVPPGVLTTPGQLFEVLGEFRVANMPYKPTLRNSSTDDYIFLSTQLKLAIKGFFMQNVQSMMKDLNETNILSFRKGENFGLNGIIAEFSFLMSTWRSSRQIGLQFVRGLDQTRGALGDYFKVDMRTLRFSSETEASQSKVLAHGVWSEWSAWSKSCLYGADQCDSTFITSRQRTCLHREKPSQEIKPLFCPGLIALEIKDCVCPFKEVLCSGDVKCRADTEVCVQQDDFMGRPQEPKCLPIRDPDDPRGCGGHCMAPGQLCRPSTLSPTVYQCIEDFHDEYACQSDEWRCKDTLCIPKDKRCDGHLNCFDKSDEDNCPCDTSSGLFFRCGSATSCLSINKRCDGFVDCWDGSDENSCFKAVA